MFLLPLYLGIAMGKWTDAGKMAGCLLLLPALLFGPFVSARIEIDDHEIRLWNFGILRRKVRFDQIGRSIPQVLGEKDWPVSLTIVGKDGATELLSVGLKVLRKEDVSWLLARPELRVVR